MGFNNIRDAREGFVDMSAGDKLIGVESKILGIVTFIGMLCLHTGFFPALIVGILVMFVFPWLVGLVEIIAWIAAIVFSLVWAIIGYFIGGALLGDSVLGGIVVAIIIFTASFFLHKIFGGLGYHSVEKHVIDSVDATRNNTAQTANSMVNIEAQMSSGMFCTKCGARMTANQVYCSSCGSKR